MTIQKSKHWPLQFLNVNQQEKEMPENTERDKMIDGYYNNLTHTKGDDGERRVEEFCAKNNCLISRPTNQSFPYDLMVD